MSNEKNTNPTPTVDAPAVPRVAVTDFIQYVDYNKVPHVALVTAVINPTTIGLVSFAAIDGDEACERQRSVIYSADPAAFNVWRKLPWPTTPPS